MTGLQIIVSLKTQALLLVDEGRVLKQWMVSTALNGPGQESGSHCTPLGRHIIRAKIGGGCPANTVFVGRRPTGEVFSTELEEKYPRRDWILTRILWLSGVERGFNRLGSCDSMRRFIYIHGCPDSCPMGIPLSHGCIRMRNQDLIDLFDAVPVYTPVLINA